MSVVMIIVGLVLLIGILGLFTSFAMGEGLLIGFVVAAAVVLGIGGMSAGIVLVAVGVGSMYG